MKSKTLARILCVILCIVLVGSVLLAAIPMMNADAAEHTPVLPPEAEKSIHRAGLELLAGAVMLAKDNLAAEAEKYNKEYADDDDFSPVTARDYATTLLIVITRESSQGRLIISFSVGDGVIACCEHGSPGSKDATLHFSTLNEQDCGKYAGETRFITSNSIFR